MMREGDHFGRRRPPLLIACLESLCTTISSCLNFFCCCWFLRDRYDSYSPLEPHPPAGPTAASSAPPGLHIGPATGPFGVPGGPSSLIGPFAPPPPSSAAAFEPDPLGPPGPPLVPSRF